MRRKTSCIIDRAGKLPVSQGQNCPQSYRLRDLGLGRLKQVAEETQRTIYQVKHDLLDDYLRQQLKAPAIQCELPMDAARSVLRRGVLPDERRSPLGVARRW